MCFILGGSGAGKSTTLCFLNREEMIYNEGYYDSKKNDDQLAQKSKVIISHS